MPWKFRLVEELLKLHPAVIVVGTHPALQAARNATSSVPIIMVAHTYDPLESGLINSIGRPGGNITGISARAPELSAKRIELLKESIPAVRRLAVIWDLPTQNQVEELKPAASSLGVEQSANFRLVVNLRTAKALGIKVPESILLRADEVLR